MSTGVKSALSITLGLDSALTPNNVPASSNLTSSSPPTSLPQSPPTILSTLPDFSSSDCTVFHNQSQPSTSSHHSSFTGPSSVYASKAGASESVRQSARCRSLSPSFLPPTSRRRAGSKDRSASVGEFSLGGESGPSNPWYLATSSQIGSLCSSTSNLLEPLNMSRLQVRPDRDTAPLPVTTSSAEREKWGPSSQSSMVDNHSMENSSKEKFNLSASRTSAHTKGDNSTKRPNKTSKSKQHRSRKPSNTASRISKTSNVAASRLKRCPQGLSFPLFNTPSFMIPEMPTVLTPFGIDTFLPGSSSAVHSGNKVTSHSGKSMMLVEPPVPLKSIVDCKSNGAEPTLSFQNDQNMQNSSSSIPSGTHYSPPIPIIPSIVPSTTAERSSNQRPASLGPSAQNSSHQASRYRPAGNIGDSPLAKWGGAKTVTSSPVNGPHDKNTVHRVAPVPNMDVFMGSFSHQARPTELLYSTTLTPSHNHHTGSPTVRNNDSNIEHGSTEKPVVLPDGRQVLVSPSFVTTRFGQPSSSPDGAVKSRTFPRERELANPSRSNSLAKSNCHMPVGGVPASNQNRTARSSTSSVKKRLPGPAFVQQQSYNPTPSSKDGRIMSPQGHFPNSSPRLGSNSARPGSISRRSSADLARTPSERTLNFHFNKELSRAVRKASTASSRSIPDVFSPLNTSLSSPLVAEPPQNLNAAMSSPLNSRGSLADPSDSCSREPVKIAYYPTDSETHSTNLKEDLVNCDLTSSNAGLHIHTPDLSRMTRWEIEQLYYYNAAVLEEQMRISKLLERRLKELERESKKSSIHKLSKTEAYVKLLEFVVEPDSSPDVSLDVIGSRRGPGEGEEFGDVIVGGTPYHPIMNSKYDTYGKLSRSQYV